MNIKKINRKLHYWVSIIIIIPCLVIFCSGLLLQVKKHWNWIQPTEHRGIGEIPKLNLEEILSTVKNDPDLGVTGWEDVNRLDVRPGKGLAKVLLHNGWEIQVDLGTGQLLSKEYRRSDIIESIHDGSFFAGKIGKYGVVLPTGIGLLVLLITGIGMFRFTRSNRRKGTDPQTSEK